MVSCCFLHQVFAAGEDKVIAKVIAEVTAGRTAMGWGGTGEAGLFCYCSRV